MWKKDNSSFSPVPPAAGPRTLALFSEMMDEIVAVAAKAQRDIAKAMGRCVRKYQQKVRVLESQRRSRGTVNKLRAAKAKLRAFELKDKEDREMLVKAKSIEIGPENAEFWIEKDTVIGDRVIHGLRKPDGKITRKPEKMLKVAKDFYTDLFSQAETNPVSQYMILRRLPSGNFIGLKEL